MKTKYIVLIVVAVLALILVLQNRHVVSLKLFFWEQTMSLVVFAVLMVAVGFLLGLVTARATREPKKD